MSLDPGFVYEDVNGDVAYQDGTDDRVTKSDPEGGFSTVERLVVPDSVGTIAFTTPSISRPARYT